MKTDIAEVMAMMGTKKSPMTNAECKKTPVMDAMKKGMSPEKMGQDMMEKSYQKRVMASNGK